MNDTSNLGEMAGGMPLAARAADEETILDALHSWLVTVDHKKLGLMYIIYGLVFLVIGGLEAALIRLQLIAPGLHLVGPQAFNRLFTMHGTTMVFLVGMPLIFGFANYLVPLMIGARDLAFPRLNAFGFWLSAFGGLLLYFSYIGGQGLSGAGSAPDVGWFAYAPLTAKAFSRGHSTDYWTLGIMVSGFGSIATAANIITTILLHALPRHDPHQDAAPGVALPGRVRHGADRGESVDRRPDYALARSLRRLALLRYPGRRFGGPVDAFLLDIRTPRSLYPGHPRLCFRLGNHPGLLAQGDLRLPGDGGSHLRHRLREPRRLGPSHVHGGHDLDRQHLLCGFDHDNQRADGH